MIELVPAGGWFTEIIAPVVKDRGKLYVALGPLDDVRALKAAARGARPRSKISESGAETSTFRAGARGRRRLPRHVARALRAPILVVTFRNLHNSRPEVRALLNKAVFAALKPGGIYGVLDHTRRHIEPDNPENGRRVDPVRAIHEIQPAGFVFEDYSTILFSPADALALEVGNPDVANQTDRDHVPVSQAAVAVSADSAVVHTQHERARTDLVTHRARCFAPRKPMPM